MKLFSLKFSPRFDEPTFHKAFNGEERLKKKIEKIPIMSGSMILAEGIKISQTLTQVFHSSSKVSSDLLSPAGLEAPSSGSGCFY